MDILCRNNCNLGSFYIRNTILLLSFFSPFFFFFVLEPNQSDEDTWTQVLMCQAVVLVLRGPRDESEAEKSVGGTAGAIRRSSDVELSQGVELFFGIEIKRRGI